MFAKKMYLGAMLNCLEKGQKEDIQGDVNEIDI